jgi:hypothetical protein
MPRRTYGCSAAGKKVGKPLKPTARTQSSAARPILKMPIESLALMSLSAYGCTLPAEQAAFRQKPGSD